MILPILKVLSIVSTAFFGLFASLTNFRDVNNKITLNGKIALVGVIISSILAGSVQVLNDKVIEDQSNELMAQNNAILLDVRKTLNPFSEIKVNYYLSYDLNDKLIFDSIDKYTSSKKNLPIIFKNNIEFNQSSNLYRAIKFTRPDIYFCKESVSHDSIKKYNERYGFSLKTFDLKLSQKKDLIFDFYYGYNKKGQLFLDKYDSFSLKSVDENWTGNGSITSVYDLLGLQLLVHVNTEFVPSDEYLFLGSKILLSNLTLTLQDGSELSFNNKYFEKIEGTNIYSLILPKKLEELKLMFSEKYDFHSFYN